MPLLPLTHHDNAKRPVPLFKRRRFIVIGFAAICAVFFLRSSISSSLSFGLQSSAILNRNITSPSRNSKSKSKAKGPDHVTYTELDGLIYFLTMFEGSFLPPGLNVDTPMDRKIFLGDQSSTMSDEEWEHRLGVMRKDHPLVIFSKTYCPYSRKAKELISTYNVDPPPHIIEVDERVDGDRVKTLLTRLTGRSTFPNVILDGKSIGGSDELRQLEADGLLGEKLEESGLRIAHS